MALTETLTDDFNNGVIDGIWTTGLVLKTGFDVAVTVVESGGVLNVTPITSTGSHYNGVHSTTTYDLTNSYMHIQVPQIPSTNLGYAETYLMVGIDGSNRLQIVMSGAFIGFQYSTTALGLTTVANITYSGAAHRWWRIRHGTGAGGPGGDVVYFDTSDGVTWTNQGAVATPFAITAVVAELVAGTYGSLSTPGSAQYDWCNLLPPGYVGPPNFPGVPNLDIRRMIARLLGPDAPRVRWRHRSSGLWLPEHRRPAYA